MTTVRARGSVGGCFQVQSKCDIDNEEWRREETVCDQADRQSQRDINQSTECPAFVHLDADSGVAVLAGAAGEHCFVPSCSPQPPIAFAHTPSPPSILSIHTPWSFNMHPRLGSAPGAGFGMSIGGKSKTSRRALSADLRRRAVKSRYDSRRGASVAAGAGGTGWMTTCLK